MDWSQALFQVIDFRSFSTVWYWIIVAVVWSSVNYWVLGVPYDLIVRARRHGGQAEADLMDILRINVTRQLQIAQTAGLLIMGFAAFVLTSLVVLGFFYGIEMAQAVFLLALPLSGVGALTLATARRIMRADPEGELLYTMLLRHRLWTQIIGMVAIFVTAMYGMYQNLGFVRAL